tara:strand:- start:113 stop:511 length:399 start_codon:yes stop_codon:yes gene_type:complete
LNKEILKSILSKVESIAVIGASSNPSRDSNKVIKFLIDRGYEVFPINPKEKNNKIYGKKFFSDLSEINEKIDMVDIFRAKDHVLKITEDSIKAGINIIWTQEGIIDEKSETIAKNAGVTFVMNECPKKVLEN